ncbi:hypothetical protein T12_2722 [Trichinella patagoniensis]|uniref:Uncharacterized protein n=1 Tax=Trichinella patagoniensis TaxID=990121 RepID=A0A0V0Z7F0_9BILA|nr:hypothetical protein T12_2722 [Trichinella patagoniensis]
MNGPWTRGKVWPAYSTAFDWCVPRAHWPAGGRIQSSSFDRVQANGRAESRKLVANQYVGNFRGRLGARWIPLGSFLEGPRSSWPVFGTHRTFLASVGVPWLSVSVCFERHTCGRPDTTRPPPSSCVARNSVTGVCPAFDGTQSGHRTWYCAWFLSSFGTSS